MKLDLHIDTLVLEGFDPHQREAIGKAVQQALTRLLVASQGREIRVQDAIRLRGFSQGLSKHGNAQEIGGHIAASVYRSLGGNPAPGPSKNSAIR